MTPDKPTPRALKFHFIKSSQFRVVHVDGAIGAPNPHGNGVTINFFSERFPIPTTVECELLPDGDLGKEVSREIRDGVVREIEFSAVMSKETAESLRTWLDGIIKKLDDLQKEE